MPAFDKVIGAQMVLWERPGDEALRLLRVTAPPAHEQITIRIQDVTYDDFRAAVSIHRIGLVDRLIVPVKISVDGLRKIEGAQEVSNEQILQKGGNILFADELTVSSNRHCSPGARRFITRSMVLNHRGIAGVYPLRLRSPRKQRAAGSRMLTLSRLPKRL